MTSAGRLACQGIFKWTSPKELGSSLPSRELSDTVLGAEAQQGMHASGSPTVYPKLAHGMQGIE